MKTGMIENTFELEKSFQKKIEESGLKEEIEPFDAFSCGVITRSKLESNLNYSKKLEKEDFPLGDDIVDVYRFIKDNEPLREIYIHVKGKK